MRRTAPEESNLATNSHPPDTAKAEFVRTYRSATFPGLSSVPRYEQEIAKQRSEASTWKVFRDVPKTGDSDEQWLQHFPDLY
eukprot:928447-Karenia_brevis.AAC.1